MSFRINNLKLESSFLQSSNIVNSITPTDSNTCNYKLITRTQVGDENQGYYLADTNSKKVSSLDLQFNNFIINTDILKSNINNIQLFIEYYEEDIPTICLSELFITPDSINEQLINCSRLYITNYISPYYYVFYFNYFPRLKQLTVSGDSGDSVINVSSIESLTADSNLLSGLTMCNGPSGVGTTTITGPVDHTDGTIGIYEIQSPLISSINPPSVTLFSLLSENITLQSIVLNSLIINIVC